MDAGAADLLNGKTVLIVEDESLIAQDVAEAFRDAGATIIGVASTTPEARRLIETHPAPDLAILNIRLRGETVFDFAEDLKRDGVPFMFISGYGRSMIPAHFANEHFCQKPVQSDVLIDKARQIIASRG